MNLGIHTSQNLVSYKHSFPLLISKVFYVFKREVNLKWLEIFMFLVTELSCNNCLEFPIYSGSLE